MPKKTLALICGLVAVTFILFVIALNNNNNFNPQQQSTQQVVTQNNQTPAVNQQNAMQQEQVQNKSVLSISPNPVIVAPGQKGSVDVNIDTLTNDVTAVQLEIAYDPNIITNVKVSLGDLITDPVNVLFDSNRVKDGRYTYGFGIIPNHPVIKGSGKVATITFTALNKQGMTSQLALLPESLITARGISESVLKSGANTLIQIGQPGTSTGTNAVEE